MNSQQQLVDQLNHTVLNVKFNCVSFHVYFKGPTTKQTQTVRLTDLVHSLILFSPRLSFILVSRSIKTHSSAIQRLTTTSSHVSSMSATAWDAVYWNHRNSINYKPFTIRLDPSDLISANVGYAGVTMWTTLGRRSITLVYFTKGLCPNFSD